MQHVFDRNSQFFFRPKEIRRLLLKPEHRRTPQDLERLASLTKANATLRKLSPETHMEVCKRCRIVKARRRRRCAG